MVVHNVLGDEERFLEVLDAIRRGAQGSSEITVRVLSAVDHDGVCAAQILGRILTRASLKYSIAPVTGNEDIINELRQLEEDTEVRSVVLLNCGASLDLQEQLEVCKAPAAVHCYVIDAHRPFLLANLKSRHHRVVVLDDDHTAEGDGPRPPADTDEEDEEQEEEASLAGRPQAADGSESEADLGLGGAVAGAAGRHERLARRLQELEAKRAERLRRMNEYYLTSYYATPAAMSLFKMARQAASPSHDDLWLAAVALAGYYDQGLMNELTYSRLVWEELKDALDKSEDLMPSLFSSLGSQRSQGDDTLQSAAGVGGSDDEAGAPAAKRPRRRATGAGRRGLHFQSDLALTLYKHWNLEDSVTHTAYFHGALALHRDKGLRALKNFFATAGIPPSDYKQLYGSMQMPIRKTLHAKFRHHGKPYGLMEKRMFLQQFVRDLGPLGESNPALHLHELCCMDAVHVVTALLTSMPGALGTGHADHLPVTGDGRIDTVAVNEMERQALVENFWRAFDAVLCKEPMPLQRGIEEAVEVVKAVQSLARLITDTKAMHNSRQFRWCKLERAPGMFRQPMAVRRLAVWLMHTLYTFRPNSQAQEKPLLLIVRDQVRDTYLCVGVASTKLPENTFGNLYRIALRADHSLQYRYDYFDRSCIEIAADDFDRFWELIMDAEA